MDVGVDEITRWHIKRKFRTIGYHHVIRRSGLIQHGRPVAEQGAHVRGHNKHSIGICLVGGLNEARKPDCNFTAAQWESLNTLVTSLSIRFFEAKIVGHRDLARKACPTFDVAAWRNQEIV